MYVFCIHYCDGGFDRWTMSHVMLNAWVLFSGMKACFVCLTHVTWHLDKQTVANKRKSIPKSSWEVSFQKTWYDLDMLVKAMPTSTIMAIKNPNILAHVAWKGCLFWTGVIFAQLFALFLRCFSLLLLKKIISKSRCSWKVKFSNGLKNVPSTLFVPCRILLMSVQQGHCYLLHGQGTHILMLRQEKPAWPFVFVHKKSLQRQC